MLDSIEPYLYFAYMVLFLFINGFYLCISRNESVRRWFNGLKRGLWTFRSQQSQKILKEENRSVFFYIDTTCEGTVCDFDN